MNDEKIDLMLWMRYFMAGFFIVFSFFKFLNLAGFAESYAMYDELAKRVKVYGLVYPFLELFLGVASGCLIKQLLFFKRNRNFFF